MSRAQEIYVEPRPEISARQPAPSRQSWLHWVRSSDHKRVGILFVATSLFFLALAVTELLLLRVQLGVSDNTALQPEVFNQLLSVYGTTAIFLVGLPLGLGLAHYLVPLQIGARTTAFPRLGAASYWLCLAGGALLYATFLYAPPEGNLDSILPLSDDAFLPTHGVDAWTGAVGLVALGAILGSINIAVTVARLRAPGMFWRRVPLFAWSAVTSAWLLIVIAPVLLAGLVMLFVDRNFSGVFFDPGEGGAPLLWQHIWWFFLTPGVFAILLPAMGAVSEILATLSRKPPFGHGATAAAFVAIALIAPLSWMQNMYTAPIRTGYLIAAMVFALMLAIPFAVLFFNWIATLWGGALRFRAALLFAVGAVSTMSLGLAGHMAHAVLPVGWALSQSSDATANSHYLMIGGLFGAFAALYYWFPKMTGRTMAEGLGRTSFWTMLIGVHVAVLPLAMAGINGQPVDIHRYFSGGELETYNLIATIGTFVLALGILLTLANAALSATRGVVAGHDPWLGSTLEWLAPSPPPENNFDVIVDVRSSEPLHDIRDGIERRSHERAAARPGEAQPVA